MSSISKVWPKSSSRTENICDFDCQNSYSSSIRSQTALGSVSRVEWLEHILHPWSSLIIVPIFAFANAGVKIDGDALVLSSPKVKAPVAMRFFCAPRKSSRLG